MSHAQTNKSWEVFIPGRPRPKGRPRLGKGGVVYTPPETREWEEYIAGTWLVHHGPQAIPAGTPLVVVCRFLCSDNRVADVDNLQKAVLDGLRVAIGDDRRVVLIVGYRDLVPVPRGEEGVHVLVIPYNPEQMKALWEVFYGSDMSC